MNRTVDYCIVGLGIAGLSFCETLQKNNKSFVVIDTPFCSATRVSAGIINPLVLKRFTPVWNVKEHITTAIPFYKNLEHKLKKSFFTERPMLRIFTSVEEQNNWMVACDKKELSGFLHPEIITNTNPCVNAPLGYGKVYFSGIVNTEKLLDQYVSFLTKKNAFLPEKFQHHLLEIIGDKVVYKNIKAKHIVFTEGFSARENPFFDKTLIIPNKGEFIVIKAPKLNLQSLLKTSIFIVPLGNHFYKIGATYDREDITFDPTKTAKDELLKKLKKVICCDFTITDHVVGMRPTTIDRRPLLGSFSHQKNIYFFTGLGTRGIISAPSLAQKLFYFIENNKPLANEIDLKRRC